ncbi:MAG: hypothetical protein QM564_13095 [Bergeyella sp.]
MKKIALSLALAFIGTFAMAQKTEAKKINHEERQEARLNQLKAELNLSDNQVAQLKALQEKRKNEMKEKREVSKEERAKKMEEMKARRTQHEAEMKAILTPEQYDKWHKNREAEMKAKKEELKSRRPIQKENKTAVQSEVK